MGLCFSLSKREALHGTYWQSTEPFHLYLLIQRAGIFAQTGLSTSSNLTTRLYSTASTQKEFSVLKIKFCLDSRRLKWRLVGLTCNACSYRDNAGRVESKATPVNVFIGGSRSSRFRLLWILDSSSWPMQTS